MISVSSIKKKEKSGVVRSSLHSIRRTAKKGTGLGAEQSSSTELSSRQWRSGQRKHQGKLGGLSHHRRAPPAPQTDPVLCQPSCCCHEDARSGCVGLVRPKLREPVLQENRSQSGVLASSKQCIFFPFLWCLFVQVEGNTRCVKYKLSL